MDFHEIFNIGQISDKQRSRTFFAGGEGGGGILLQRYENVGHDTRNNWLNCSEAPQTRRSGNISFRNA